MNTTRQGHLGWELNNNGRELQIFLLAKNIQASMAKHITSKKLVLTLADTGLCINITVGNHPSKPFYIRQGVLKMVDTSPRGYAPKHELFLLEDACVSFGPKTSWLDASGDMVNGIIVTITTSGNNQIHPYSQSSSKIGEIIISCLARAAKNTANILMGRLFE